MDALPLQAGTALALDLPPESCRGASESVPELVFRSPSNWLVTIGGTADNTTPGGSTRDDNLCVRTKLSASGKLIRAETS